MSKISLDGITSLTNETSVIAALTQWKQELEAFSELVLSRNGEAPNTMTDTLDMNSQRIINLPAPLSDNEPVRLVDVAEGVQGPQGIPGDPGGPLADGDYGDIVVSGVGTAINIDSSVITTAARTVLDDVSVAAMRTTLGLGGVATLSVGTTAGTIAAGDDSRFSDHVISDKNTTSSFTLTERLVQHSSASPHTFTVDPISTTAYPQGRQIIVWNYPGAGDVTITGGSGVTLLVNGGLADANATLVEGAIATLVHNGADGWFVIGPGVTAS